MRQPDSIYLLLWLLPFLPSPASGQIRLNEVYYDHPGRDDNFEFVELINPTDRPIALAGVTLEFHDGASSGWKTIWQADPSDTIAPGSVFVVGGSEVAPRPDAEVALVLQNGPDAVRLVANGAVLDLLGYGALSDAAYFEGASAPDVPEGWSLSRIPDGLDSDDNAADFHAAPPTPGAFNVARHDVALRPGHGTETNDRLRGPGPSEIRLRLVNRGSVAVAAGEVEVALGDSTDIGLALLGSTRNGEPIAASDSVEVGFSVRVADGYHLLLATLRFERDERPRNDTLLLRRRAGDIPLVVSEVMSLPREGCPEYVEVYNAGEAARDLSSFSLGDAAGVFADFQSAGVTVPPGGFLVVTPARASLLECFPLADSSAVSQVARGWPSLNSTGSGTEADSVLLLDHWGIPVDRISYPPQPPATKGRSLERIDLYPGERRHTWVLADDRAGGTPGRARDAALLEPPAGGAMILRPNPFAPRAGERLVVTLPARPARFRSVVRVFDVRGRELAEIGSTTEHPFVFVWEGRDGSGRLLAPGLYIVTCEGTDLSSGARTVEKVVMGCAEARR